MKKVYFLLFILTLYGCSYTSHKEVRYELAKSFPGYGYIAVDFSKSETI